MNFQPVGPRVLIRRKPMETKTASGLFIPEEAYRKTTLMGEVVAVGTGLPLGNGQNAGSPFQVGDIVLYYFQGGMEVVINNETFLLLQENDCFGRFTPEAQ